MILPPPPPVDGALQDPPALETFTTPRETQFEAVNAPAPAVVTPLNATHVPPLAAPSVIVDGDAASLLIKAMAVEEVPLVVSAPVTVTFWN